MKFLKAKDLKLYREKLHGNGIDPIVWSQIINPVLDHDHETGYIRGTLDREVNQYLGKCEQNFKRFIKWKFPYITLPELLRNISRYLEKDYSNNLYHPNHLKKLLRQFNQLNKSKQLDILCKDKRNKLFRNDDNLQTKEDRLKAYKKLLLT